MEINHYPSNSPPYLPTSWGCVSAVLLCLISAASHQYLSCIILLLLHLSALRTMQQINNSLLLLKLSRGVVGKIFDSHECIKCVCACMCNLCLWPHGFIYSTCVEFCWCIHPVSITRSWTKGSNVIFPVSAVVFSSCQMLQLVFELQELVDGCVSDSSPVSVQSYDSLQMG